MSIIEPQPCAPSGGGEGVTVHNLLTGRSAPNAHPQSAVVDLVDDLQDLEDTDVALGAAIDDLEAEDVALGADILALGADLDQAELDILALGADITALEAFDASLLGLAVERPGLLTPGIGVETLTFPGVPRMVWNGTPISTVSSSVAQTNLFTTQWQSAANQLAVGDLLHVLAGGTFLNNTAGPSSLTLRVRGDAVTIASSGVMAVAQGATGRTWRLDAWITITSSTTTASGGAAAMGGILTATNSFDRAMATVAGTVDLTQPIDWEITGQLGNSDAAINMVAVWGQIHHVKAL